jgi:predicted NBD/HSP70 family sugar kinase
MNVRRLPSGSSSSTIKSRNLSAVLLMLLRYGTLSRVRLAELTGLSTTTITNLISELIAQGIVAQNDGQANPPRRRAVGRPQLALELVPTARYAIGVHIGVGSVHVALCDLLARPQTLVSLDHPLDRAQEDVMDEIVRMIRRVIVDGQIDPAAIVGVGFGASGLVDPESGVNVIAPNLGWRDVPVRDTLAAALHMPVIVDNNVRAMALGEALFGAGKDVYSLAYVYVRVGVGAGIVVGGQLYYGGGAGAGEIGHMTILPHGGAACRCGNRGCLETLVSEPVVLRLAEGIARREPDGRLAEALLHGEGLPIERVFAAARDGDASVRAMLDEQAYYMGVALANVVDILNPELIIMGGIFALGQDLLLPGVSETMRQCAFAHLGDKVRLETPTFYQHAGVIGAAALALDGFFYQQVEASA